MPMLRADGDFGEHMFLPPVGHSGRAYGYQPKKKEAYGFARRKSHAKDSQEV